MLVALVSAYKEGPLLASAVRSALQATPHVWVCEGPAGEPLDDPRIPDSDLAEYEGRIHVLNGRWKTDAQKRTHMIEALRGLEPPVWGVWIDGDEVLCNPEYLADWIRSIEWQQEFMEAEEEPPYLGWPIKLVELDGSVVVCRGKVVRIDLIDGYSVSSSVFRNTMGFLHGEGNVAYSTTDHVRPFLDWIETLPEEKREAAVDQLRLWPPFPCEPFLMHRSALRHPLRRGLRMHHQEEREIEREKAVNPLGN